MSDEATDARIEELLRDLQETVEENNRLLRRIQRGNVLAFWGKLILWTLVIVLPIIFIKPILSTILPFAGVTSPGVGSYGLPSQAELQQVLQAYKGQQAAK